MEYVGEHLIPGQLGRFFINLAFTSAVISAIAYYFFIKINDSSYKKFARLSFIIHTVSVFGIVAALFYLMLNHYFEYDYVWKHSSLDLPRHYILSAFWEGQEGSFILWLFWHVILGVILIYTAKKWEAPAMIIFALVQAFLTSMLLGIYPLGLKIGSSPFILMRNTPENIGLSWTQMADYLNKFPAFTEGRGLNPILQNYWMTIHPPILFLGFASTLIPFSFAMAALFNKDFKDWIKPAIPWAFFSVMILGSGILMGGAWAYEALSFGGFWAWDPVENSSLVPWLTMVGAAHLLLIYRNCKTALTSAFFMVIITFLLILYSTFLTRSGVLGDSSVHAFVDLGLSGQLLIYLLFFVLISLGMYIYRYKAIPKSSQEDSSSSREFWMFIGSLTLLISSFQIIFSTSIPIINTLIGPEGIVSLMSDKMAPPSEPIDHYNSFQLPFAIVITSLIVFGQFLNYGNTSCKKFWKNISRSLIIGTIVTILFAQLYNFWRQPIYLVLLFTSFFAVVSNLDYWLIIRKAKMSFSGSSIAHAGFAFIIVGALISNAKKKILTQSDVFLSEDLPASENALIELGDTVRLGNYLAVWSGKRDKKDKQFYQIDYYSSKKGFEERAFTLEPFLQLSDNMGPISNPSTQHFWDRDIYTHVTYSSFLESRTDNGYANEMKIDLARGDTAIYQGYFIIMDSLKGNASINEETKEIDRLQLIAKIKLVNVLGEEYIVEPVCFLEGSQLSHQDAVLEKQHFKFRFTGIDTETNKAKITAWTKSVADEKPFIVMKAIIFPLINLLWTGCILMIIGTAIAIGKWIKA